MKKQADDDDNHDETRRFLSSSSSSSSPSRQQHQQQQQSPTSYRSPPSSPRLRRAASSESSSGPNSGGLPLSPFCRETTTTSSSGTTSTNSLSTTSTNPPPLLPPLRYFCCFGQLFVQLLPDRVARTLRPVHKRRLRNLVSVIGCLAVIVMMHNILDSFMTIPSMISGSTLVKIKDGNNWNSNVDDNDAATSSSVVVVRATDDTHPTGTGGAGEEQRPGEGVPGTISSSKPIEPALPAYPHVDPPKSSAQFNASQHFVERWCDLDNNKLDWYPQGEKLWQRRAPAFIIPGAKFAGTDLLVHYLTTTPSSNNNINYRSSILPPTFHHELSFFFDARFQKYVSTNSQKTLVRQARERLYAKFYNVPALQKQPHLISFDASSGYLFYSTLLPRRIFCVMPWIRLVIVLRNPTDRLYHHYRSAQRKGLRLSFEEWIDKDFRLLRDVGFFELNNATTTTTTSSSSSSSLPWSESIPINNMTLQDIAWFQYQQQSLEGAVGRSLYEVQLRQWFQALRAIGRKPAKSVLIVWTNDLIDNPQVELTRIAQFLQLVVPPMNASSSIPTSASALKTSTSSAASLIAQINATTMTGMNSQTRQRLDDFFRPYNKRLKDILKGFGIPDSGNGLSALPMPKKRP